MIDLADLLPAGEHGWRLLIDLHDEHPSDWTLIGGQMVYLLALEHGSRPPRATADMDVVVDVRARPGGVRQIAEWLVVKNGFTQSDLSADGLSHRFSRPIDDGRSGAVIVDLLAPEGLSRKADLTTIPPGRTVRSAGTTQALARTRLVEVRVSPSRGGEPATGTVRCPDLLGGLVLKAAATSELSVRSDRSRDWRDCALLLSVLPDPLGFARQLTKKDRQRLRRLAPLMDREHVGWEGLDDMAHRTGTVALHLLLEE